MKRRDFLIAAGGAIAFPSSWAVGQSYPTRQVRLIVPLGHPARCRRSTPGRRCDVLQFWGPRSADCQQHQHADDYDTDEPERSGKDRSSSDAGPGYDAAHQDPIMTKRARFGGAFRVAQRQNYCTKA